MQKVGFLMTQLINKHTCNFIWKLIPLKAVEIAQTFHFESRKDERDE